MNREVLTRTRNEAAAAAPVNEPVGDAIASALADIGVTTIFGVISIHNMPILDAIGRQGRIRFIPARGEAGAMNMADSYARVSRSLGIAITSTGTAAGNAAGSQVEALTAGSPVLHITTQVDREFMDRDRAAIHDVPRQPDMLKAVSKHYVRAWEPVGTVDALLEAAAIALTPPTGPVTLEIPVDVQRLEVARRKVSGLPVVSLRESRSIAARRSRRHGTPREATAAVAWGWRPRGHSGGNGSRRARLWRCDQH